MNGDYPAEPRFQKTDPRLLELSEVGDPTEDGWEVIESETWFYGPLEVVRE